MPDLFEKVTKTRKLTVKRQVRFWSSLGTYKEFKKIAMDRGLFLQDIFNDFMEWFINEHKLREAYKNATPNKIDDMFEELAKESNLELDMEGLRKLDQPILPQIPKDRPPLPFISPLNIPQPPFNPFRLDPPGDPKLGPKCPQCGLKWEGAMGYVCGSSNCPMQPKITCNSGGSQ